jgi:hypothetical protein
MAESVTASASVATETPARYAKQLASHLGHRASVVEEEAGTRIVLPVGSCLMTAADGALELRADAADEEGLAVVTDVVGRHLERFGQRNELTVTWTRP